MCYTRSPHIRVRVCLWHNRATFCVVETLLTLPHAGVCTICVYMAYEMRHASPSVRFRVCAKSCYKLEGLESVSLSSIWCDVWETLATHTPPACISEHLYSTRTVHIIIISRISQAHTYTEVTGATRLSEAIVLHTRRSIPLLTYQHSACTTRAHPEIVSFVSKQAPIISKGVCACSVFAIKYVFACALQRTFETRGTRVVIRCADLGLELCFLFSQIKCDCFKSHHKIPT